MYKKALYNIKKMKKCGGEGAIFFLGGGSGSEGSDWGGQDGCERRIEVFVKIQKKIWGGGVRGWVGLGGGVAVDVNEELKFL